MPKKPLRTMQLYLQMTKMADFPLYIFSYNLFKNTLLHIRMTVGEGKEEEEEMAA